MEINGFNYFIAHISCRTECWLSLANRTTIRLLFLLIRLAFERTGDASNASMMCMH